MGTTDVPPPRSLSGRLGRVMRKFAHRSRIGASGGCIHAGKTLLSDMDRAILEQHLALAERHVTQGERHVARQRELVAKLVQGGHDTMEAEARLLLATFEELQGCFVADRDRLRAELARGSAYCADPAQSVRAPTSASAIGSAVLSEAPHPTGLG
jgi:hypothetical protein